MIKGILISLVLLAGGAASAKDMTSLYDDQALLAWQARYANSILSNVNTTIWPRLTAEERRGLASVNLCFPLRGPSRDPFEFYARLVPATDGCEEFAPPVVVLPTLSVKFFDDLSVAHAWLWRHNYSPETALDYAAMLKYAGQGQFGGRYPAPLPALQIPNDALADPVVDEESQKLLKSAIVFLVLHELGHVLHGHPGYDAVSAAQARTNERQADQFALSVMRRIGVAPFGMVFWFETHAFFASNRGDFASDAAYAEWLRQTTHPVTEDRLRAIAAELRHAPEDFAGEFPDPVTGRQSILSVAEEIDRVAGIMADPEIQELIAARGRRTNLGALAPRGHGELLAATDRAGTAAFDGVFDGQASEGAATAPTRTVLQRNGDQVTGQYSYGAGVGQLSGVVQGDTMWFRWQAGGDSGSGRLVASPDGMGFEGTWGYGENDQGGGSWLGWRP